MPTEASGLLLLLGWFLARVGTLALALCHCGRLRESEDRRGSWVIRATCLCIVEALLRFS